MMLVQNEISTLVDLDNIVREDCMKQLDDVHSKLIQFSGSTIEGAMMARWFQVTSNILTSATPISSIYHCYLRPHH